MKQHYYQTVTHWTSLEGTVNYRSYSRNHTITAPDKVNVILASSDPSFMGDSTRYNPEELFLASLSSCHMLWYLHLCTVHKIVVTDYRDRAEGTMEENEEGQGRFTAVTLFPAVTVKDRNMISKALALHKEANAMCFIANSCNLKISHQPKIAVG
ncbi:MAG: OsmC family protein [Bacteroidota bacterium]